MKCAILIPSLGRAQYIGETLKSIEENTPEDHLVFVCATQEYIDAVRGCCDGRLMFDDDDPDKRYVTRMNKLVREVRKLSETLDIHDVFFGSDDVIHMPGWLPNARKVQRQGFGCVVVNDVRNQSGTQALMTVDYLPRACFDDPEAAFHHGYKHNFADTEQFRTAAAQGQLARAMDSVVEHLHPNYRESHRARPMDSTYADAQAHWDEDATLFEARMKELIYLYA